MDGNTLCYCCSSRMGECFCGDETWNSAATQRALGTPASARGSRPLRVVLRAASMGGCWLHHVVMCGLRQQPLSLFTSTFKKKAKHLLFEGRHACIPGKQGNAMADTRLGKHSGCFKVTVIAYCAFLFCPQEIIKLMIPFPGKSRNSINFSDSS